MKDYTARLRDENEELKEKVIQLKEELGLSKGLDLAIYGLTSQEMKLLNILVARKFVSKEAGFCAVRLNLDYDYWGGTSLLDVVICKVRKKLKPYNIKIETIWGRGLCMSLVDRAAVRKAIEQEANK